MIVIALGLLALAAFAAFAEAARRGSAAARTKVLAEAVVLLPLASLGALLGVVLLDMRCDESCDENLSPELRSGEWWHTLDAWQWYAQFAVAAIGLAAVCGALVSVTRSRYRLATALMVVAAGAFGAWAAFLAPLGDAFGI